MTRENGLCDEIIAKVKYHKSVQTVEKYQGGKE